MSNEDIIIELTKRIEELENAENKRKNKKRVKIIYEISKISIILIIFIGSYLYINAKIIKPYKEATNTINETVSEKLSDFEETFNDKIDSIKNWFKK